MSLVSVVIPTHNRSKYIERAIASVLAQTYADLEAIVVDDGSADDTARVAEAYARKDSRIRLIQHERRKGAQAARNTGIFAATGKWIAFLDSDDEWLHDSLALRLQLADEARLQVVHSECYVASEESTEMRRFGAPALQGWIYQDLLRKTGTVFPSLLVLKECLKRIGYLDESILAYQEWEHRSDLRNTTNLVLCPSQPSSTIADTSTLFQRTCFERQRDTSKCLQSTLGRSSGF